MDTNSLTIIASILIPMFIGFVWVIIRMSKKFKHVDEKFERIGVKLDYTDLRVSCLEDKYEERLFWERRAALAIAPKRLGRPPKNKTEEPKQE